MDTPEPISLNKQKIRRATQMTLREQLADRWALIADLLKRLWRSPSARVGGFIVIVTVTTAIAVPLFDDYDALRDRNLPARYAEPDCVIAVVQSRVLDSRPDIAWEDMKCDFPFGADKNGRGIMRRVGHGMSVSLWAGLVSVAL
ncbi:MAG: hypothetical protein HY866_10665, partial [Chloroflexi bacterium]|nr:hypothetical protein [Chloroflexota bacterium]